MPGQPVPFKWITDLPPSAQKEIERDFLAVIQQINPDLTVFDAIIDPSYTSSDPGNHIYKNLTDLIANESWASTYTFLVGVKQRNNPQIVEPTSPLSISELGNLALFGLGPVAPDATHFGWNWAVLSCAATQQVSYYNLAFEPASD